MRRKLFFECLYLCALSLLSRVNNCLSDMDASTSLATKTEIDREESQVKVEDATIQHCSIGSLNGDSSPIRRKRYAQPDSTSGSKIDAIPEDVGSQISERTWRRLGKKSAASNSRIAPDTVGIQNEIGSDTRSLLATDETDDPSSKKSEKRSKSSLKHEEAKNDGKNGSVDEEPEESDETAVYSDDDPEAAAMEPGNEEPENRAEDGSSDEASENAEARNAKRDIAGTEEEEYADVEEPNESSIDNSAMSDEVPVFEERYEEDNRSKRSNDEATKSSEQGAASETRNNVAKVANAQKRRSVSGRRDAKNVRRSAETRLGESKDVDSAKENSESSVAAAPKNEPEDRSNRDTKADSAPSASDSKPSERDSETDDKAAKSSSEETKEDDHGESSSNGEETEAQYVKRVQDAIQRQIDAIKENVKREIEEEDRIAEIERNNAKYDELQARYAEEDRIARDSAATPGAAAASVSASASASPVKLSNEPRSRKRRQRNARRRIRRSRNVDASQLRDIEGVAVLDSEVYEKANLLHESIRKRAAPVYGAIDKLTPGIEGAEVKKVDVSEKEASSELSNERGLSSDEDPRRAKRSSGSFNKQHRRSEPVVPEGRAAFLDDRVEIDEENDEGNEFDGDGFAADPALSFENEQSALENNRRDFLLSAINRDRNELVARQKRAGSGSEDRAHVHGGRTMTRRQARERPKHLQKIGLKKSHVDRDKRLANLSVDTKSDSVASLTGSSQELSPRLATEYKEAFGGLQTDSGGALARYKRIKRVVRET